MLEKESLEQLAGVLHDALGGIQMTSKTSNVTTAVILGVAITAVAGVAVAVAVGGTALLYEGGPFRRRWRRRKHYPLAQQLWNAYLGADGCLSNSADTVIHKVRWGGVDPEIRAEVWPFLLGVYDFESTLAEREAESKKRSEEFEGIRKQCQEVRTTLAEKRFVEQQDNDEEVATPFTDSQLVALSSISSDSSEFWSKGLKAVEELVTWQRIIRLDAVRMNAEWVPYSPSQASIADDVTTRLAAAVGLADDEHLEPCRRYHAARLVAILEAYALYDPETGYCQGMSDLLSPFVALMDEDFEAFWCFVYFMKTARHNFRIDEVGIRRQLNAVSDIIKCTDPELYEHLLKIRADDCTFVYRMVVVLLRRELSFEQTLCLWEVMWADWAAIRSGKGVGKGRRKQKASPSKDLLLFAIAAAVCRRRSVIIDNCKGMDELLRECNSMAGKLDVWGLLDDARDLITKMHPPTSD